MTAAYPTSIYSPTTIVDASNYPQATHINTPNAEIVAIETALGTNPQSTAADVKTRLAQSLDGLGNLKFAAATTLTIATGAITPTQNWHLIANQGGASSDDIDTILATNVADGFTLILTPAASGKAFVLKHGTGNIYCHSATDITAADVYDRVDLIYNGTLSKWVAR